MANASNKSSSSTDLLVNYAQNSISIGIAKTRSMTRNHIHDGASSSRKRSKACDNDGGVSPWSDLNHNLLSFVMIRLGFGDYYSFRGVCKSWRSLAHSDEKRFMASRPPMSITISTDANEKACFLEDFEGKKFKTILPSFAGGTCVGLSCGYLIFFNTDTHDFWLFNPITRKQLHFPDFPDHNYHPGLLGRFILVFLTSISGWVFVVMHRNYKDIWFCIVGTGAWNHVSYTFPLTDLYAFKGKLYTLTYDPNHPVHEHHHLCELRLNPEPKFTLIKTKNSLQFECFYPIAFVSSSENLYVIGSTPDDGNNLRELDLGETKWVVSCENTMREYAFFYSNLSNVCVAVKRELWTDPQSWSLGRYDVSPNTKNNGRIMGFSKEMWYFPHEYMNVDHIDE